MSGRRVALLVGCADYDDPSFNRLKTAAQDVESLRNVLADPEIGDFEIEHALLNEQSGEVSTRIEEFFGGDWTHDDLLLLYFSCHGLLDSNDNLYFVAKNTEPKRLNTTAISAQWVRSRLKECRSRRIVLLLDCCYSGGFPKGRGTTRVETKEIVKPLNGLGRVVITASGKREHAHESIFTDAVVSGLRTGDADLDGDGQVSIDELYHYVYERVCQSTRKQAPEKLGWVRGKLRLAWNHHVFLPLPGEVEKALKSGPVWMRLWGVDGLQRLLSEDHPAGVRLTARKNLRLLQTGDANPEVRTAARKVLPMVSRRREFRFPGRRYQGVRRLTEVGLGFAAGGALVAAVYFLWPPPGGGVPTSATLPPIRPNTPIECHRNPSPGVLSLGTLLPESGDLVYQGPALRAGVDLAIKEILEAGPINGINLELIPNNRLDEFDRARNASESADMLLNGGVDAIIGPSTSPVSKQVISKITCAGVIMFSPANTSPFFTSYDDKGLYFRTAPLSTLEGRALAKLVTNDGNSRVLVMSSEDEFAKPLREATENEIRKSSHVTVLPFISYNAKASDYKNEIERIKGLNTDAIVLIGFAESAKILQEMINNGIGPRSKKVYIPGANMTRTLVTQVSQDRSALAGVKGTPLYDGGPGFENRLKVINPILNDFTYAAQAYDAVVITVLAAVAAHTDEPAGIAKEINGVTKVGQKCTSYKECKELLEKGTNIDYDGPSGQPLEFTDRGEPCSGTYFISKIDDTGDVVTSEMEKEEDCK